jgi:aerobic carbon-monoxide dehydrogenase medium subunit
MQAVQPFDYRAPDDLDGVFDLLASHGPDARLLAGGQSLLVLLRQRLIAPAVLVDLKRVPELATIDAGPSGLALGSTVRHAQLAADPRIRAGWPLLAAAAGSIGSLHIRNRGTIGGSLAHADPAADLVVALIACDGRVVARTRASVRSHQAEDLPTGVFETCLDPGAVLTRIEVPVQPGTATVGYARFALREGEFPMCQAAVRLTWSGSRCTDARVAVGGAAERPIRLPATEALLAAVDRAAPDVEAVLAATASATAQEVRPFADVRGSAAWKRRVVAAMVRRAVGEAMSAESAGGAAAA